MRGKMTAITFLAFWLALSVCPTDALADGGAEILGRRGDRVISVFTTPTPAQVGQIDLSVLVQQAESGRAVTDSRLRCVPIEWLSPNRLSPPRPPKKPRPTN